MRSDQPAEPSSAAVGPASTPAAGHGARVTLRAGSRRRQAAPARSLPPRTGHGRAVRRPGSRPPAQAAAPASLQVDLRDLHQRVEDRGYAIGRARAEAELARCDRGGRRHGGPDRGAGAARDRAPWPTRSWRCRRRSPVASSGAELQLDPTVLVRALEAAVAAINGSPEARVLLHPDQLEPVQRRLGGRPRQRVPRQALDLRSGRVAAAGRLRPALRARRRRRPGSRRRSNEIAAALDEALPGLRRARTAEARTGRSVSAAARAGRAPPRRVRRQPAPGDDRERAALPADRLGRPRRGHDRRGGRPQRPRRLDLLDRARGRRTRQRRGRGLPRRADHARAVRRPLGRPPGLPGPPPRAPVPRPGRAPRAGPRARRLRPPDRRHAGRSSAERRDIGGQAPHPLTRARIRTPLSTGVRAIDGLLTTGKGQRLGIFAGLRRRQEHAAGDDRPPRVRPTST